MKEPAKYMRLLFAICLLAHCTFIYLDMHGLQIASKLLLLPLLLTYFFIAARKSDNAISYWAVGGLVLSFIGDAVLTQPGETMFLAGMLAFIGTHICNGVYFLRLQKGGERKYGLMMMAALVLFLVSVAVFQALRSALGSMQVPILAYMAIISAMAVLAVGIYRKAAMKQVAARLFIPGAFFFVVSDALLALNKFSIQNRWMDIAVMLTYGMAQYCLVRGFASVRNQ